MDDNKLLSITNLNDGLVKATSSFLIRTFNYPKLKVKLKITDQNKDNRDPRNYSIALTQSTNLQEINGHAVFLFKATFKSDIDLIFTISYLPCLTSNQYVKTFLLVVGNYILQSIQLIARSFILKNNKLLITSQTRFIYNNLTTNIEKSVFLNYMFIAFNDISIDQLGLNEKPKRYSDGLLNKIWRISHELSTIKIENEELYCGFIFQDRIEYAEQNSVRRLKFIIPPSFNDVSSFRNYLKLSNGQDAFLNVKDLRITELILTRNKLKDIYISPIAHDKVFYGNPLIVSIQGTGKVLFIKGGTDANTLLFQIVNGVPLVRDIEFIKNLLAFNLSRYIQQSILAIDDFIDWVLSLALNKRGTSILIGDSVKQQIDSNAIKHIPVDYEFSNDFEQNKKYDFNLLNQIILIDGGIAFNKRLQPSHIGTIVENSKNDNAFLQGSRHNAIINFTEKNWCLGIVVSEDGPITLYEGGKVSLTI